MRSTVCALKRWRGSSVARLSLSSVSAFSEPRWWYSHFCGRTWDGCRGDPAIRRRRACGRSASGSAGRLRRVTLVPGTNRLRGRRHGPRRRIYESDALQVAAYLIALRATANDAAATFGYLRYATGTFRVGLTRELEQRVRAIVDAIRAGRSAATVNRSHSIVQRCVNCSVREQCNQALG